MTTKKDLRRCSKDGRMLFGGPRATWPTRMHWSWSWAEPSPRSPSPKESGGGKKKRCYENAFDLLGQHPTLVYCEGFVLAGPALFPVEHAWCVDEAGNVVDNTLREPGVGYFGIPFDSKWIMRKVGSGADSLVDQLLLSKKIPKTAIAKPYRR